MTIQYLLFIILCCVGMFNLINRIFVLSIMGYYSTNVYGFHIIHQNKINIPKINYFM